MTDSHYGPGVLAAGEESVREYLCGLGMPQPDIDVYLDEARRGRATFSFGTDDEGWSLSFG